MAILKDLEKGGNGKELRTVENVFTKKFPDLHDFPYRQKTRLFEPSSIVITEKVFRNQN